MWCFRMWKWQEIYSHNLITNKDILIYIWLVLAFTITQLKRTFILWNRTHYVRLCTRNTDERTAIYGPFPGEPTALKSERPISLPSLRSQQCPNVSHKCATSLKDKPTHHCSIARVQGDESAQAGGGGWGGGSAPSAMGWQKRVEMRANRKRRINSGHGDRR